MSKQEIIIVLTPGYADWESVFLAAALQDGIQGNQPNYTVKT